MAKELLSRIVSVGVMISVAALVTACHYATGEKPRVSSVQKIQNKKPQCKVVTGKVDKYCRTVDKGRY